MTTQTIEIYQIKDKKPADGCTCIVKRNGLIREARLIYDVCLNSWIDFLEKEPIGLDGETHYFHFEVPLSENDYWFALPKMD